MSDSLQSPSTTEILPPPAFDPASDAAMPSPEAATSASGGSPQQWAAGGTVSATPRFYMTSDLRAATGLTRTHLDFYLREDLIRPTARTESGYLLFDEAELATLRTIITWRHEGHGIKQIRERLGR